MLGAGSREATLQTVMQFGLLPREERRDWAGRDPAQQGPGRTVLGPGGSPEPSPPLRVSQAELPQDLPGSGPTKSSFSQMQGGSEGRLTRLQPTAQPTAQPPGGDAQPGHVFRRPLAHLFFSVFCLFTLWPCCVAYVVSAPQPEADPCPLQWTLGGLTSEPAGNCPCSSGSYTFTAHKISISLLKIFLYFSYLPIPLSLFYHSFHIALYLIILHKFIM